MSKKKILSEQDIQQKYIIENKTLEECCSFFNCSHPTFLKSCRKYGIVKFVPKNIDAQVIELVKKGVARQDIANELGVSLSTIKRAIARKGLSYTPEQQSEKISRGLRKHYKNRKIRVYGRSVPKKIKVRFPNKPRKEYHANPKYGKDNPATTLEVKQKIVETNLRKYGHESAMQDEEIKQRVLKSLKQTLANKYDYSGRIRKLEQEYQRLGRPLFPRELEKLWGLTNSNVYTFVRRFKLEDMVCFKKSLLESEIEEFLKANEIEHEKHNRQVICPQEIDFYIPKYKVGIEVNDIGTHNSTVSTRGGKPKSKQYHYKKSVACEKKGIRLIHIWDYEWYNDRQRPILESIILGSCNKSKTIFARKCKVEVRPSKDMKDFFQTNNIQGFRGGKFAICLVYEGEVVMAYNMGKAFFGKGKYEWEVIRGATKLGYRVIGGASRIWKYFVRNYNPQSCVYYVDYNYFNGNSVPFLGFRYVKTTASFKNYFTKTRTIKNRNPMKHKEIRELAKNKEVWEVWNAGAKVYVWEREAES